MYNVSIQNQIDKLSVYDHDDPLKVRNRDGLKEALIHLLDQQTDDINEMIEPLTDEEGLTNLSPSCFAYDESDLTSELSQNLDQSMTTVHDPEEASTINDIDSDIIDAMTMVEMQSQLPDCLDNIDITPSTYIPFPIEMIYGRPYLRTELESGLANDALLDSGCRFNLVPKQYLDARAEFTEEKFKIEPTSTNLVTHTKTPVNLIGEVTMPIWIKDCSGVLREFKYVRFLVSDFAGQESEFSSQKLLLGMQFMASRAGRLNCDFCPDPNKIFCPLYTLMFPKDMIVNEIRYKTLLQNYGKPPPRKFILKAKGRTPLMPKRAMVAKLSLVDPESPYGSEELQREPNFSAICELDIPGLDWKSEQVCEFENGETYVMLTNKKDIPICLQDLKVGTATELSKDECESIIELDHTLNVIDKMDFLRFENNYENCVCDFDPNVCRVVLTDDFGNTGFPGLRQPLENDRALAPPIQMQSLGRKGRILFLNARGRAKTRQITKTLESISDEVRFLIAIPPKLFTLIEANTAIHFVELATAKERPVDCARLWHACEDHQPLSDFPGADGMTLLIRFDTDKAAQETNFLGDRAIEVQEKLGRGRFQGHCDDDSNWLIGELLIPKDFALRKNLLIDFVRDFFHKYTLLGIAGPVNVLTLTMGSHFLLHDILANEVVRAHVKPISHHGIPQNLITFSSSMFDITGDSIQIESIFQSMKAEAGEIEHEVNEIANFQKLAENPKFEIKLSGTDARDLHNFCEAGKEYDRILKDDPNYKEWLAKMEDPSATNGVEVAADETDDKSDASSIRPNEVEIPIPQPDEGPIPWREYFKFPDHLDKEAVAFYSALFDKHHEVFDKTSKVPALNIPPVKLPFLRDPVGINATYPVSPRFREPLKIILERFQRHEIFEECWNPEVVLPSFIALKVSKTKGMSPEEIDKKIKENPQDICRFLVDCRPLTPFLKKTFESQKPVLQLLLELPGAKVFSSFDAMDHFFSIKLDAESSKFCVIGALGRYWRSHRLLQGMMSSPAISSNVGNMIRAKLPDTNLLVYIDDFLLYQTDVPRLREDTTKFVALADELRLRLPLHKCSLETKSINYLGFILEASPSGELSYLPSTTKTPVFPPTAKELCKNDIWTFAGFANYFSAFLPPSFQLCMAPLYALLSRLSKDDAKMKVPLDSIEALSWKVCVSLLAAMKKLHLPLQGWHLDLYVDSSFTGVGLVITCSEKQDSGEEKLVYNYFKSFPRSSVLANTSLSKEILGVLLSLRKGNQFIYSSNSVRVTTDCTCLVHLVARAMSGADLKSNNSLPNRYLLSLSTYYFVLYRHFPRTMLRGPDILSKLNMKDPIISCAHFGISAFHKVKHCQLNAPLETGKSYSINDIQEMVSDCLTNGRELYTPMIDNDAASSDTLPDCDNEACKGQQLYYPCQKACPVVKGKFDDDSKENIAAELIEEIDWISEFQQSLPKDLKPESVFPCLKEMRQIQKLDDSPVLQQSIVDELQSSWTDETDLSKNAVIQSPLSRISFIDILQAQQEDEKISEMIREIQQTPPDQIKDSLKGYSLLAGQLLCKKPKPPKRSEPSSLRPVVPRPLSTRLIVSSHIMWGHIGYNKCYRLLRRSFYIYDLRELCRRITVACRLCLEQRHKTTKYASFGSIYSETPLKVLFVDFMNRKPTTVNGRKYKYIFGLTCAYSGMSFSYATRSMKHEVVCEIIRQVLPLTRSQLLVGDNQSSSIKHLEVRRTAAIFGCDVSLTRPYGHIANIMECEWSLYRTQMKLLKSVTGKKWPELVSHCSWLISSTPRRIRKFDDFISPWEVVFKSPVPEYRIWDNLGVPQHHQSKAIQVQGKILDKYLSKRDKIINAALKQEEEKSKIKVGTVVLLLKREEIRKVNKDESPYVDGYFQVIERRGKRIKIRSLSENRVQYTRGLEDVQRVGILSESLYGDLNPSLIREWKPWKPDGNNVESDDSDASNGNSSSDDDNDDDPTAMIAPPAAGVPQVPSGQAPAAPAGSRGGPSAPKAPPRSAPVQSRPKPPSIQIKARSAAPPQAAVPSPAADSGPMIVPAPIANPPSPAPSRAQPSPKAAPAKDTLQAPMSGSLPKDQDRGERRAPPGAKEAESGAKPKQKLSAPPPADPDRQVPGVAVESSIAKGRRLKIWVQDARRSLAKLVSPQSDQKKNKQAKQTPLVPQATGVPTPPNIDVSTPVRQQVAWSETFVTPASHFSTPMNPQSPSDGLTLVGSPPKTPQGAGSPNTVTPSTSKTPRDLPPRRAKQRFDMKIFNRTGQKVPKKP